MRGLSGPLARAWQRLTPALVVFGTGSVLCGSRDHLGGPLHRSVPGLRQRTGRGRRTDGRCLPGGAALHRSGRDRHRARRWPRPVGCPHAEPLDSGGHHRFRRRSASRSHRRSPARRPVRFRSWIRVRPRRTSPTPSFAVLGFAAACYAMLQVAFSRRRPRIARFSLVSSIAVGVISGAGGLLALVHVAVDFGSWLEFAGMTVAIAWLATYGLALVVEGRERDRSRGPDSEPDAHERMHAEAAWPRAVGTQRVRISVASSWSARWTRIAISFSSRSIQRHSGSLPTGTKSSCCSQTNSVRSAPITYCCHQTCRR